MKRRTRIVVPARPCQGGMFEKFEEDPYDVELHGIVTADEYRVAIRAINERIRKARPGKVDGALLATGALLFPLAIWGARRSRQMKKRKKHLLRGIDDFNAANPTLLMRWNRRPKSVLTIERREGDGPTAMAEAQFVGDLVIQAMPPQQQRQQMAVPPQQHQPLMAPNAPQHQRMTSPPAPSQIPASHAAASSPGIV